MSQSASTTVSEFVMSFEDDGGFMRRETAMENHCERHPDEPLCKNCDEYEDDCECEKFDPTDGGAWAAANHEYEESFTRRNCCEDEP